jgi:amino acid transporter
MAVPRGIIRAVAVSAIVGWLMLIAMVIAIPDMNTAVNQGSNVFFWLIDQVLPNWLNVALLAGITVTQYCCGLAMITSASRVIYAFSRDGGMPFSDVLSSVSPVYRTPRVAVWLSAILTVAFTLLVPYITITAVGVIFLYVSYVMPTVASVFSHGRTWTKMGPWDMGLWYKPLAVICVISSVCLVVIGIQPPNEIAAYIIPAFVVILLVYWFAYKRNVFAGPPSGKITEKRHIEILEIERALNEGHG